MEGGIILIFIPLLTLSADVLIKFQYANDDYGDVNVQHLDELYDVNYDKYKQVLHRCDNLPKDTTSTLFVFLSPQFLVHNNDARHVMLRAAEHRTLRVICIDECHVHCQHGSSFRDDIRALRDAFFAKVFQPSNNYDIRFLATTATMPQDYIPILSSLTTISFPPDVGVL